MNELLRTLGIEHPIVQGPMADSHAGDWMLASFPVVTPQTSVSTALRLLDEHHIPALPVCEGGQFLGLVDEQALLRCTPSELATPHFRELPELLTKLTVSECVAKSSGIMISPATPIEEVAALMARYGVDTLPVTQDGRPVGLVTWTFVLGAAMVRPRQRTPVPSRATSPLPKEARAAVIVDPDKSNVRDWMIAPFPTISQRTTVATAIHLLQTHHAPVLPVCEEGRFLGFVGEKGLLRLTPSAATSHSIPEIRRLLDKVPIGGMFVFPVASVNPGTPLHEAAALMVTASEGVVPVLDDESLVGLLSWDGALAAFAGETPQHTIPKRRGWLFWM